MRVAPNRMRPHKRLLTDCLSVRHARLTCESLYDVRVTLISCTGDCYITRSNSIKLCVSVYVCLSVEWRTDGQVSERKKQAVEYFKYWSRDTSNRKQFERHQCHRCQKQRNNFYMHKNNSYTIFAIDSEAERVDNRCQMMNTNIMILIFWHMTLIECYGRVNLFHLWLRRTYFQHMSRYNRSYVPLMSRSISSHIFLKRTLVCEHHSRIYQRANVTKMLCDMKAKPDYHQLSCCLHILSYTMTSWISILNYWKKESVTCSCLCLL